jgi:hypothetical protein
MVDLASNPAHIGISISRRRAYTSWNFPKTMVCIDRVLYLSQLFDHFHVAIRLPYTVLFSAVYTLPKTVLKANCTEFKRAMELAIHHSNPYSFAVFIPGNVKTCPLTPPNMNSFLIPWSSIPSFSITLWLPTFFGSVNPNTS